RGGGRIWLWGRYAGVWCGDAKGTPGRRDVPTIIFCVRKPLCQFALLCRRMSWLPLGSRPVLGYWVGRGGRGAVGGSSFAGRGRGEQGWADKLAMPYICTRYLWISFSTSG